MATATRRRSESDHAAGLFPQTMSVMGNRWGFAILVAAFVGVSRFTDFQTQLGAPPGSIADRLSIFTANGVFEVSDNRYRLTEKGRALFPVLVTALQWAQRWYQAPEGPAVTLTHTVCGRRFEPRAGVRSVRGTRCAARTSSRRHETELVPTFQRNSNKSSVSNRQNRLKMSGTLDRRVLTSQVHSDLVARQGGGL